INYDDSSGSSDSVTKGVETKATRVSHFAEKRNIPEKIRQLLEAVKEIETVVPKIALDIEFAVDKSGAVTIFQVRPITRPFQPKVGDAEVHEKLSSLKARFRQLSERRNNLAGERTILADMPDWNPAEIIGDAPNFLDYALYDYIITDSAWHEARASQGYYNVNPAKLVLLVGNKPYVDVRNSFNSFAPACLPQHLREKLVSFYLDKLERNPELQDKVEFDVVYSCYDFCFEDRAKELPQAGFSEKETRELKRALTDLTSKLVLNAEETIREDLNDVKGMEEHRAKITGETQQEGADPRRLLESAKMLLDKCRENGTVQFSRIARLAFVGDILLKSLVKKGAVSNEFYDGFMNSVSTIATELRTDFEMLCSSRLTKEGFIKKYGHLRPGTYDITSMRYDSNPALINTAHCGLHHAAAQQKFKADKETLRKIDSLLKADALKFNARQLLEFTKRALEAREYSKFEFTKNLSEALELIAVAGDKMGFTREELAMLGTEDLFSCTKLPTEKIIEKWKGTVAGRDRETEVNKRVILPPVICSEKDFDVVNFYSPRPNFITQKKVSADTMALGKESPERTLEISGKIVLLENGDPGYDWIFTRNIAGLITKYGGVASHMSIRCAEFGVPAAIGCAVLFDSLLGAKGAILDCKAKKITPTNGGAA
ncbi:MAG: PEP-utilizing enzyme, partial [Candidatus Diapherotrites archaeon]|nr:PEP-utilizing enzyme [Candidatus Diapherotrites archaeon]